MGDIGTTRVNILDNDIKCKFKFTSNKEAAFVNHNIKIVIPECAAMHRVVCITMEFKSDMHAISKLY